MTVKLDEELCAGCGLCEEIIPEIFKTGRYTAELRKSEVQEDFRKKLEEIIEDCPAGAISIS